MSWIRGIFQNDPEKILEHMSRDLAMAGIALEQVVKERNKRMMGSLRGDANDKDRQMVLLAHQGANYCQFMLVSYFLIMYARYWSLREEYAKLQDWRTIFELHKDLQKFRGTHGLYRSIHEAFMTLFDIKFDQFHTVTTMLGIPTKEEDKTGDGIGWLAADEDEMKKRTKAKHAARDRAKKLGIIVQEKGDYPSFETSVELARLHWEELIDLDPIISDFDSFLVAEGIVQPDKKAKDEPKKDEKKEKKKSDKKAKGEPKTEGKEPKKKSRKVRTAK